MDGRAFFQRIVEQDPSRVEGFAQARAELELALRIAEQRSQAQLTQGQLAGRIGISQPVIARLELGGRTPTLSTLWKLATALRVEFHVKPDYGIDVVPVIGGGATQPASLSDHPIDDMPEMTTPAALVSWNTVSTEQFAAATTSAMPSPSELATATATTHQPHVRISVAEQPDLVLAA